VTWPNRYVIWVKSRLSSFIRCTSLKTFWLTHWIWYTIYTKLIRWNTLRILKSCELNIRAKKRRISLSYFNSSNIKFTYILLNGLTYNPAEYFTSFERIFPSSERESKNARNEYNARPDYVSNHSIGFLLYDKPEKIDFHVFFGRICMCIWRWKRQIISNETREQQQNKSRLAY
jgi:hypothetical protein